MLKMQPHELLGFIYLTKFLLKFWRYDTLSREAMQSKLFWLPFWKRICSKPLSCWIRVYPAFANSEDPDQFASEEANWSGSALFAIKYVNLNLYQQSGSSNLIG